MNIMHVPRFEIADIGSRAAERADRAEALAALAPSEALPASEQTLADYLSADTDDIIERAPIEQDLAVAPIPLEGPERTSQVKSWLKACAGRYFRSTSVGALYLLADSVSTKRDSQQH